MPSDVNLKSIHKLKSILVNWLRKIMEWCKWQEGKIISLIKTNASFDQRDERVSDQN